jgi:very-short-patch-repair endonuclease
MADDDHNPVPAAAVIREAERVTEQLRKKLLDLSGRNRLLSFTHRPKSRSHIRVIDELPHVLFERLQSERPMTFQALPAPEDAYLSIKGHWKATPPPPKEGEPAKPIREISLEEYTRSCGLDPAFELPEHPEQQHLAPGKHTDNDIQVRLFEQAMEKTLSGIADKARSALNEMGVNTLFAVFGFLEWVEQTSPPRKRMAPLILLPVRITKTLKAKRYRYELSASGEEVQTNLALQARLKHDFGVVLPSIDEDITVEEYLATVEEAIEGQREWGVRRFITVGHFSFARIAMYNDLDPELWSVGGGTPLGARPLVATLFGQGPSGASGVADEVNPDDPWVEREVPGLIADCDSSQFSAIYDVVKGKNLALKGPPGTGKSQTITNLIAAAMTSGKRVLFMAEKMAALEVVKKRLDDAGLGPFCLELHSTKSKKSDVLRALRERDELRPPIVMQQTFAEQKQRLKETRDQLHRYADALNQPFGGLKKTPHDIYWAELRARAAKEVAPPGYESVTFGDAAEWTRPILTRTLDLARRLEDKDREVRERHGARSEHPWCGLLKPIEVQQTEELAGLWRTWLESLDELKTVLTSVGQSMPMHATPSLDEVHKLISRLKALPQAGEAPPSEVLARIASPAAQDELQELVDERVQIDQLAEALSRVFSDPINAADALTAGGEAALKALPVATRARTVGDALADETAGQLHLSRLVSFSEQLSSFLAAIGHQGEPTLAGAEAVSKAAGLLRKTDDIVLAHRTEALLSETSRPVLEEALVGATSLAAERSAVGELIQLDRAPELSEVRSALDTIRQSGFFSFFSGDYRRAKKLALSLMVTPKPADQSFKEAASEALSSLESVLAKQEQLAGNTRLQAICGAFFAGTDTDFQLMTNVNAWGAEVATLLRGIDPTIRTLRELLKTSGAEELRDAFAAFGDSRPSDISDALAWLGSFGPSTSTLAELIAIAREACAQTIDVNKTARELGCQAEQRLADVVEALGKLKELKRSLALARACPGLAHIGDSTVDVARDALSDARRALDLAKTTRAAPFPRGFAAWLLADYAARAPEAAKAAHRMADAFERIKVAIKRLRDTGWLSLKKQIEDNFLHLSLDSLLHRVRHSAQHEDALGPLAYLLQLEAQAAASPLQWILVIYNADRSGYAGLEDTTRWVFFRSLVQQMHEAQPILKRFDGRQQEDLRARFAELDRAMQEADRQRMAAALAALPVPEGNAQGLKKTYTDRSLIRHEYEKKKRHIPLRDLFDRAGAAITAMKPCVMMSPVSVAQYLPRDRMLFDLVVIDEASQMTPEDALGALSRAKQAVIVGDPQQLPPTSFFSRIFEASEDEEDEEEDELPDTESILSNALRSFFPPRDLRWHYRSRHESLIAFSNHHFYDRRLIVFPSPADQSDSDLGVKLIPVKGSFVGRVNEPECQAIVKMALEHMRRTPDRSLGIATMNSDQRELILEAIDRVRAEHRAAEQFYARWSDTLEPLFVKNLENVQGDERDTIFVSGTYGPSESGRVMQRFGPINSSVGHRRLNVLFTRAKKQVVLFSSMRPEDVKVTEKSHDGVRALRNYLEYAATGRLHVGEDAQEAEPDSDFEVWVAQALKDQGLSVTPQVGVAGFRIDLGVKHPDWPYGYLFGVECDGAAYHSSRSARDRDRLRQEVLEGLGWDLYRIWSTDWFRDAPGELRRLMSFVEERLTAAKQRLSSTN